MSNPLMVSIPHRLGQEEALRRIKSGLDSVRANHAHLFSVREESWTGGHLQFRVGALGQVLSGTIDVLDDRVNLKIVLPWLLASLAGAVQSFIRKEGTLMLEKK
jgi:hypothetical protein